MQPQIFTCPYCSDRLSADESDVGHYVECPSCQRELLITNELLASGSPVESRRDAIGGWLKGRYPVLIGMFLLLAAGLVYYLGQVDNGDSYSEIDSGTARPITAETTASKTTDTVVNVPGPECFVISFAKNRDEAQRLAEMLSNVDNSARYQVFRDGDTSPKVVEAQDRSQRKQELRQALYNGTVPQFNSVNYLLLSALYAVSSAKESKSISRLIIIGDLPPAKSVGGKGVLTTAKNLSLLPKSVEVLFIESRSSSQLNGNLREAYKLLGYTTKVIKL